MSWRMLRAPIQFFDSNTIGSILTRFSKDMAVLDFMLPGVIEKLLINVFRFLASVTLMAIAVPLNLIGIIVVLIPIYWIQRYQKLAQNDSQRLEAQSKGPINLRYSSAIDGMVTIRAYRQEKIFYR